MGRGGWGRCFAALLTVTALASLLCHGTPSPTMTCWTWAANSVQNVTVGGFAWFGAAEGCGVELINVSITFFALPQSTIVLDGWLMQGVGSVAIQGPPEAPWSIRDVAVIVTNSVIEAVDGPAVSVILGARYNGSAGNTGSGLALRNVSLYCVNSRLQSTSGGSELVPPLSATAAVLSVIFSPNVFSASIRPNVSIESLVVVAFGSTLASAATSSTTESTMAQTDAIALVVSIAAPIYGNRGDELAWVTVSNSVLYIIQCNATATASSSNLGYKSDALAASAVAGVAMGQLSSVRLNLRTCLAAVVESHVDTTVTVWSNVDAYAGSTVAGVAMVRTNGCVTDANGTTFYVGRSLVRSRASADCFQTAFSGSSVAGVAVGQAEANSPITIANGVLFFVTRCNVTSVSSSISANIYFYTYAYAASSVAAVAVGVAASNSSVTVTNHSTLNVGWSNVTSVSTSWTRVVAAHAGSSVAGIAVGQITASSPVTIANGTTFYVGRSTADCSSSATNLYSSSYSASSTAGVAVGQSLSNSALTMDNSSALVGWSNVTCISTYFSTNANTNAASSVGGVAMGQASSNSSMAIGNGTTFYAGWSSTNCTNTGRNYNAGVYTGCTVAGIAVAQADESSPLTVPHGEMFFVGWSNATSYSNSFSSNTNDAVFAASSVAGVAFGQAAMGSNRSSVTSAALVSACVSATARQAASGAVSCLMALQASSLPGDLCCAQLTASNETFPITDFVVKDVGPYSPPLPASQFLPSQAVASRRTATYSFTSGTTSVTTTLARQSHSATPLATSSFKSLSRSLHSLSSYDPTHERPPALPSAPTQSATRLEATATVPATAPMRMSPSPAPTRHTLTRGGHRLGLDSEVVTAFVAGGYGSTAIAAAISPTSGNKPSTASHVVSSAECAAFGDEALSSFPQPDDWSLMPGFAMNSGTESNDSGEASAAAAFKVVTTILVTLVAGVANGCAVTVRLRSAPRNIRIHGV